MSNKKFSRKLRRFSNPETAQKMAYRYLGKTAKLYPARYVDQGGGKRNGSFAIYLEPCHGDIYDFLDLKKNHGDEEMRARDMLFYM